MLNPCLDIAIVQYIVGIVNVLHDLCKLYSVKYGNKPDPNLNFKFELCPGQNLADSGPVRTRWNTVSGNLPVATWRRCRIHVLPEPGALNKAVFGMFMVAKVPLGGQDEGAFTKKACAVEE